ncbi:MAG: protease modulator HflC [Nanoarchaeota archaeon]|nr:protease modulator HflC [Nanoarchaeota archaeon]
MISFKQGLAIAGLTVGSFFGLNSFYIIDETEQAVITKFGKPTEMILGLLDVGQVDTALYNNIVAWNKDQGDKGVETIRTGAGIYFKTPFLEKVHQYDDRLKEYDAPPTTIVTKDKKNLKIDTYARWRIANPLLYKQTFSSDNEALGRLNDVIYSTVREFTGKNNLIELVRSSNNIEATSEKDAFEKINIGRAKNLELITQEVNEQTMKDYGIEVVDVRIKRADLLPENAQSVYSRMRAERERVAQQYRSEGEEEAVKIKAAADREAKEIRSGGYEKAETIKGEGDRDVTKIYNDAYRKDPSFFRFWNTMESYRTVYGDPNNKTDVVLSFKSDYNKYLKGNN